MKYVKGLALVASVKPKTGDVRDPDFLSGRHFPGGVVMKVDRATARACEADGRFIVNWHEKKGSEAATTSSEPEPAPEPETEETKETEMTFEEILVKFDDLLVRETDDYLDTLTDPDLLEYLAENASKKGSRENAKFRLGEVTE